MYSRSSPVDNELARIIGLSRSAAHILEIGGKSVGAVVIKGYLRLICSAVSACRTVYQSPFELSSAVVYSDIRERLIEVSLVYGYDSFSCVLVYLLELIVS